jgi:hypothetical protein
LLCYDKMALSLFYVSEKSLPARLIEYVITK